MYLVSLDAARRNAGYSQHNAADEIGVHVTTIQRWEKDSTYLPNAIVLKFAELYFISPNRIFLGKKDDLIVLLRNHEIVDTFSEERR